jgi:hypothetical protein
VCIRVTGQSVDHGQSLLLTELQLLSTVIEYFDALSPGGDWTVTATSEFRVHLLTKCLRVSNTTAASLPGAHGHGTYLRDVLRHIVRLLLQRPPLQMLHKIQVACLRGNGRCQPPRASSR